MHHVPITARDPNTLAEVIGADRANELSVTNATRARESLRGRCVINVNSTAAGGGVAEMLHVLLGYIRAIGVDTRWLVIDGTPDFFVVTKRIHNHLYGGPGDGGPLGPEEHEVYCDALRPDVDALAGHACPGDIVILHDPQTAGLAEHARALGCKVVWRCHVGIDEPNEYSDSGWEFLRRYLEPYVDHYVFTDAAFAPPWVQSERCSIIWPSIDPFSPKNQDLDPATVEAILTHVGIIAGRSGPTTFRRTDGSPGRVERCCDISRTGAPASPDAKLIVQVSRWDSMKDMVGVMESFADHIAMDNDAELVLAGPVVSAVADDPEGGQVLLDCWNAWRELPHAVRRRVQLACLPMHDLEENAAIVNALQRHATIVVQKSIAEGFGLTVAEAMLKSTPVVASAVGGIVDQVVDCENGRLVEDPTDLEEFGRLVRELIADDELAARLGEAGRRRAIDVHLGDTHLRGWLDVVDKLTDDSDT